MRTTPAIESRRSRFVVISGLGLLAVLLGGCLGPEPSPAPTTRPAPASSQTTGFPALRSSIDPCSLLTPQQATAVNGVVYRAGSGEAQRYGLFMCSWDNAAARATVEVGFGYWSSGAEAQAAYETARMTATNPTSVLSAVANLGDAAIIVRETQPGAPTGGSGAPGIGVILVRRGSLVMIVDYFDGTPPSDAVLTATAKGILAKLPTLPR